MSEPDADQLLIRRIQAGDERAFEILVHKYQGLVLSLCRRYLGSRYAGVEDVGQEVFLRVHRGCRDWEPRARVRTWIYGITVNACLNEIRRLRTKKHRSVSSFSAVFGEAEARQGPVAVAPPDPDRPQGGEVAALVRRAVDDLPEQQRLALVLSRFHNCPYVEVAEVMGTTVAAVKSLLTRARDNLRRRLRNLVEAPGDLATSPNWVERRER